jgi:hypothetical protein
VASGGRALPRCMMIGSDGCMYDVCMSMVLYHTDNKAVW